MLKNYEDTSEHKRKMNVHKVFDESLTGNCPTDTPIERAGEEFVIIPSITVELFNVHPQGEFLRGKLMQLILIVTLMNHKLIKLRPWKVKFV